jgi:integrase
VIEYKFSRQSEVKNRAERLLRQKGVEVDLGKVTYSSINRELTLLRRLYNWYRKQKRLKIDNPVEGIEFYRETSRTRIMTEEEEPRFFIEGKAPQHVKDIVTIALSTGMRLREILNLKKEEVLLGDIFGTIVLGDTKNGESRKIPLTKELTDLFKRIIDNAWDESPYLFCNRKPRRPIRDIKTSFTKCCRRASIENLKFHDLRHTFCTRLANEGVESLHHNADCRP